ncbi:MAG: hypothetical protein DUD31_03345 [Coriobacteriaceae bacterium]|nr:MAG: hypothetical protein DUD31_03345 [Coriobacteriaceae bacterium]
MARSLDIFRQRPAAAARKPPACSGASPYGTRQPHAIVCTAAIRHPARFASLSHPITEANWISLP